MKVVFHAEGEEGAMSETLVATIELHGIRDDMETHMPWKEPWPGYAPIKDAIVHRLALEIAEHGFESIVARAEA